MLLLLLHFDSPEMDANLNNPYYEFYFLSLKSQKEKDHFRKHFRDQKIIAGIDQLTDSFVQYPFYHSKILEYTRDKRDIRKITKWQRQFYLSAYNDHIENPKESKYYTKLLTNQSFKYLINLETDKGLKEALLYINTKRLLKIQKEDTNEQMSQIEREFQYILAKTFDCDLEAPEL